MSESVLVTGATGFFGKRLCMELRRQGYDVYACWRKDYPEELKHCFPVNVELQDYGSIANVLEYCRPNYIIHAAGYNGGIKFNLENQFDIFSRNTLMGINLFEAARRYPPKKIISVVASCAYSAFETQLLSPNFLLDKPHETVACHGYAKRNLQLLSMFAKEQYGLNAATACITTMYGPGDSIDPNRTKVMMALIKKFVDAKKNKAKSVDVWGTGKARRQFIFVKDAAKLIIQALFEYNNSSQPINLSPRGDISIDELCRKIGDIVGYTGNIIYDVTKPDGQMKKELIPHTMCDSFPFTSLDNGIKETIDWYKENS